jgi:hypothetical protein
MGRIFFAGAVCALAGLGAIEAKAQFATSVVSYIPGSISPTYQNPAAALGMPSADTSFGVLTPFNSAFLGSHITGIGSGGSLTLRLGAAAATGQGATIGVHAAVGLIDNDFPNGFAGPVATPYTNPRSAGVSVSHDGAQWFSLGEHTFDLPTNFYSEGVTTPGFQEQPGTRIANFTQPFTRPLSDFDGRNWGQILSLLDGSAGGSWLDLSAVPYSHVSLIRFDVSGAEQVMYVDAVAVAAASPIKESATPYLKRFAPVATVPEPCVLGTIVLAVFACLRRR